MQCVCDVCNVCDDDTASDTVDTTINIKSSKLSELWNCEYCSEQQQCCKCGNCKSNCDWMHAIADELAVCIIDHIGDSNLSICAYLYDNTERPKFVKFNGQSGTGVLTRPTNYLSQNTGFIPVPPLFLYKLMDNRTKFDFFDFFAPKFQQINDPNNQWKLTRFRKKTLPHYYYRSKDNGHNALQDFQFNGLYVNFTFEKLAFKKKHQKP